MSSLVSISGAHGDEAMPADAARRRLSARRAATVQRLADATVSELAAVGYDDLTVRRVARRAGVAPATAYTYFTSKAHLVAEVFWRRLRATPDTLADPAAPAAERAGAALRDIAALVAAEPALAAACTPALLGSDPDVRHLRDRIGAELHRRIAAALRAPDGGSGEGDGGDDDLLVAALDLMLAGALVRAGTGHVSYAELGDTLGGLARLVIGDRS
jgi:AcrR family transcriptional regulator